MPRAMEANAAPASTASRRRKSSPTGQSSTEGAATSAMSARGWKWSDDGWGLPPFLASLPVGWLERKNNKLGEGDCSLAIARFARVHRPSS